MEFEVVDEHSYPIACTIAVAMLMTMIDTTTTLLVRNFQHHQHTVCNEI
jgi:hypothetical protein